MGRLLLYYSHIFTKAGRRQLTWRWTYRAGTKLKIIRFLVSHDFRSAHLMCAFQSQSFTTILFLGVSTGLPQFISILFYFLVSYIQSTKKRLHCLCYFSIPIYIHLDCSGAVVLPIRILYQRMVYTTHSIDVFVIFLGCYFSLRFNTQHKHTKIYSGLAPKMYHMNGTKNVCDGIFGAVTILQVP